MNKRRKQLLFFMFSIVLTISAGCAAPGSSMGILNLFGNIDNYQPSEEPLKVRVILPKQYGLGGMDHYFGKPEDYGHKDKIDVKEIDVKGDFTVTHDVVYHITCFILPPLGAFPKSPPPPVYLVGFSDCRDEVYLISFKKDKPNYKVYRMPQKEEIPIDKATWTIIDGSIKKSNKEGRAALNIALKFKRT